jgi:hypothetical protein
MFYTLDTKKTKNKKLKKDDEDNNIPTKRNSIPMFCILCEKIKNYEYLKKHPHNSLEVSYINDFKYNN